MPTMLAPNRRRGRAACCRRWGSSCPLAFAPAVFAMSVGTALTVSALALLALSSRHVASRLAHLEAGRIAVAGQMVALGLSLLAGSVGGAHPLFRPV